MKIRARVLGCGALALSLVICGLSSSRSLAQNKDAKEAVLKIADLIEKKDDAGATKEAKALGKNASLDEVMGLFRLRSKGGIGVGSKAGAVTPDGIEAKWLNLGKKPAAQGVIDKESADLAKAAYVSAAIAEIALANAPEKDMGQKKKKDWIEWSKDMREASAAVADAAKSKKPDAVKNAVAKLNSSCNNCHGVFRD